MRRIAVVSFLLVLIFSLESNAQMILSRDDSAQIISTSEAIIRSSFQNTLNAISTGKVDTDIEQAIKYSYDSTSGMIQIFYDGDIRVDDDLDMSKALYKNGPKKNMDKPVSEYLYDFRAWFQGKDKQVSYISSVIYDTMYYVNNKLFATVYFNSAFDLDDNNWPIAKRRADILFRKKADSTWDFKIYQINFNFFDRDNFIVTASSEIKSKRFSRGLIPDSLKLNYCYYKQKINLSALPDSVRNMLNQDLIAADQYYFNTSYTEALQKYEKLNSFIKDNDYFKQRIANCFALRFSMEKKSEASVESQKKSYYNFLHLEDLQNGKVMLDSIVKMQPNNNSWITAQKELANKLSVIKEMQIYLKNNEKTFKEKIDAKLSSTDSENEYLYFLRARYYESKDQHREALTDLDKALNAVPDFIEALKLRAKTQLGLGNSAKALVDLDQLIKESPKNDTLYGLIGDCYSLDKNYKEAISSYTTAIGLNSHSPDYYYKRGMCAYQSNDLQNASFDFRQAVDRGCKETDAFHKLFKIYFADDKIDSALIYLRTAKVLGLPPAYKREVDSLSEVFYKAGLDQSKSNATSLPAFNAFRVSANLNYEKHQAWYNYAKLETEQYKIYRSAIMSLDSALKYSPGNIQYSLLQAKAYALDHQFTKASSMYDMILKTATTSSDKAEAHEGRGDALRGDGKDMVAQEEYNSSLLEKPNNLAVLFKLAQLYDDNTKYLDACKTYRQIISINETDSAYFKRGLTYLKLNDAKSALRDFERALEKNKYCPLANFESGICNKRNEKFEDAIKCFDLELQQQRNYIPAYVEKADCQFTLKLYKDAFMTFHGITQFEKDYIKKDYLLSQQFAYCCLFENQSLTEAGEYINHGIKTYPNEKYFTFLLAEYSYLNKQVPEAKTYFEESFKAKAVTANQLDKDEIFKKIRKENDDIKKLWKSNFN